LVQLDFDNAMHRFVGDFFMKTMFHLTPMVAVCASMLTACGGGGGTGLSSYTANNSAQVSGTISGLGSIVVNGIRYETIGASVVDADDGHSINSPLGMGMTVSIDPLSSNAITAAYIRIQSGIQGLTAAIDANAKTLTVAGLPVSTDASTFIVTANNVSTSFAALVNGQPVEVYGLPQSDGSFKATRIEIQSSSHNVELVGVVSNLNVSSQTFTLGSANNQATITYSAVTAPAGLANGAVVSVHTAGTATSTQYAATSLYLRSSDVTNFSQYANSYRGTSGVHNETNELYGMVSELTINPSSSGCSMQVQGVPVTLANANLCGALRNGDYVEVKGLLVNGALTAYRVEFKTAGEDRTIYGYQDDDHDSDHDGVKYHRQLTQSSAGNTSYSNYEVYGTLACTTSSACTLTVNGTSWIADLSSAYWEHGQVSSGFVEAKGYMSSGNTFKVIKIESKH
jgi:Domain of unknown function (DUF5666)